VNTDRVNDIFRTGPRASLCSPTSC